MIEALSVASTILQVIDFSSKLLGAAYEAYGGFSEDKSRSEPVYADLKELSSALAGSRVSPRTENERALHSLAKRCQVLVGELRAIIGPTYPNPKYSKGAKAAWLTVRAEIHRSLSSDKIASLREDVASIQAEISTRLLNILW